MAYKNQADQNACQRRWYYANRSRKIAWQRRRRAELQLWLASKKTVCQRCGERHPGCLTFHHRESETKEINISQANGSWSRVRLEAEIAKCDVLCANCHQKLHWEEKQSKPND